MLSDKRFLALCHKQEAERKQKRKPPLAPAAGSAEMLELPNDTKIRFSNAFNAMCRHITCCKDCHTYLIEGDGDMCAFGKAQIAIEMCCCDTSIVFPPNTERSESAPTTKRV